MSDLRERTDAVIRITRQEALGSHADDLLARQRNLRGEADSARRRRGRWYYRNWFVFMIAGGVGAFAAWALLEPMFDDFIYHQGIVEQVDWSDRLPAALQTGDHDAELASLVVGTIVVGDERVWLTYRTAMRMPDGAWGPLDAKAVTVGREVGVYVDYTELPEEDLALTVFLLPNPRPVSGTEATMTLRQKSRRSAGAGLILFAVVAGFVGLSIGAVDGVMCRLPRRALLCGGVGLLIGFLGGFVASRLANLIYAPLSNAALAQMNEEGSLSTFGFVLQMLGRSLAWALADFAHLGIQILGGGGQGIALRSKRLFLYGFIGGIIGGLLGGLLFDPIDLLLLGAHQPSAHWSRLVGLVVVGMVVGVMIGVVELLARDAWLRMTEGPLAGKEFLLFKDLMRIGASPASDIYLFNDPLVAGTHANLRMVGDDAEVENLDDGHPLELNGHAVERARLRHGDQIAIGNTAFVFEKRRP